MSTLNLARWTTAGLLIALLALPAVFLSVFQAKLVEVDGRSMEPAIALGDVVLIMPPRESDFVVGSVVTVSDGNGERYTHRIVGVESGGSLDLQGDNNTVGDPTPVGRSSVVGVVKAVFSGVAATLLLQLQSWPVRLCLLVMIVGLTFMPVDRRMQQARGRREHAPAVARLPKPEETFVGSAGRSDEDVHLVVESLRGSMAHALLSSSRRLTGQMSVSTDMSSTGSFPDLRVIIDIAEKRDAGTLFPRVAQVRDARVDVMSSRRQVLSGPASAEDGSGRLSRLQAVPPLQLAADAPSPMSATSELPRRRDQRRAPRHGRRRAS